MLNFLRRTLFQTSHLSQYLPLLKESTDQKIIRLLRDPSNPHTIDFPDYVDHYKKISFTRKYILNRLPVFNPIGKYILIYYVFLFLAIMYNFVEVSLVLVYSGAWQGQLTTPVTLFFSCLTIFIFIIDVFIQLNTGFLRRGMIIMERNRIVKNYMRGSFFIDVIYIIFIILCLATQNYYLNYSKLLWLFKLPRLSEIDDYFLRRFNVKRIKKTLYTIFKQMVIILLCAHVIGVIFYIIDYYIYTSGIFQPSFCWLGSSTAYSPIMSLPYYWQYFYSLYWGINTISTISYGDIAGSNPLQLIYTTLCFCFGFIVYGYVVNQIIKVILWARASDDQLKKDVLVFDIYMANLQVPQQIKTQIRNHLKYMHKQQMNRNLVLESTMRDKLPQDLRYQLVSNAYRRMNQTIINIFQTSTATKFLFNLVQKKYSFDQPVSNQGQRALSLNFLHAGKIQYIVTYGVNSDKQFVIHQTSNQNEFLGHYELFARKRWPFSIISKQGSTVYSIDREKMFLHINSIEILKQKYKQVEYEVIIRQNLKRIEHTCFFCKTSHNWNRCPSRFPIFKSILHTDISTNKDGIRIIRRKYHTINDYKKLKVLDSIRNSTNKRLSSLIQKRINKIKEKINEKNQVLQIDIAYDWKYFDPNQNLSKKREYWNQFILKKRGQKKPQNLVMGALFGKLP